MKKLSLKHNKKGQATTELAIMGSMVIMLLAYLLQQGYMYNARQALEMYTFREALKQSREREKGVTLTVIRDVITPSFFTGLTRERLQASASVEHNPWMLYIPDVAQDIPTRQLFQVDEAMIRNELFFEVPPTKVKIETEANRDADEEDKWQWTNSAIREIDPQTPLTPHEAPTRQSGYRHTTQVRETHPAKTITKGLSSTDRITTGITFEDEERIRESYLEDEWKQGDERITGVEVAENTIPIDIDLQLDERVRRAKTTITAH